MRATAYSDEYILERHLVVEVVSPAELAEPDRWLRNLGGGEFYDGYALIVMCESSEDIKTAHRHV
ncbi:MAG: hypothetical protein GTO63_34430, partial [Anaerolineae bacterium]|nr:hypothetical protein [Anaerolineae bacterium]NIN99748.1 hypothetical protein [Anaerolineae bacterium]NIQ82580.1 hypothetical protein [Anaerolineae bacterium]